MKTILFSNKKLWSVISLLMMVWMGACKSNQTPQGVSEQQTIENPKPATAVQTDSLKRVLDEKRQQRSPKH